jgi:hypothetical protein
MPIWGEPVVRETHPEPSVRIFPTPLRLLGVILLAVLFAAFGAWLLSLGAVHTGVLGAFCLAYFGLTAIHLLRLLGTRRPIVVLDSNGITDRSILLSVPFVSWDEMTDFRHGRRWVTVDVADPAAVRARIDLARRLLLALNRVFGRGGVQYLTLGTSSVSVDQLMSEIDALAPAHVRRPWDPDA